MTNVQKNINTVLTGGVCPGILSIKDDFKGIVQGDLTGVETRQK
jgi:hypothetical protein